jgi:site-specific recombinase XerD
VASIRARTNQSGTVYNVLFRHRGKQTSETFEALEPAERFKHLVELLGAEKALAELNGNSDPDALTVDQLAAKFFDWKAGDIDTRTLTDYQRDYANWIKPTFGHRLADSVDELDVQQWVDKMKPRLDPKSIGDRHMILHSMFKYGSARVRRMVEHNPCTETQMPKRTKKPPKGMPLPVWQHFRVMARTVEPDAADLAEFIASTGWRWSEAAALTVGRIEHYVDHDGTDLVVATMGDVMRAGKVSTDSAKSHAGFRRSKLTRVAAGIVLTRSTGKGPGDLVFTTAAGSAWRQQNFLNRTWPRMLRAAGLDDTPGRRYTPHHLRHTQPGVLDRAGATPMQMQRRMGHESINTTMSQYGGQIDDVSNQVLARMNDILDGPVDVPSEVIEGVVIGELGA